MSRVAHYRVVGTFDMASAAQVATVDIDRDVGTFAVRPYKKRKTYELPLAYVAAMVCRAVIASEVRKKRQEKAERARERKADAKRRAAERRRESKR